jgi:hypothetical protein
LRYSPLGEHITQQLEQDPVLRPALVLKQQMDLEFATTADDPVHEVRAVLAQVLAHIGVFGDFRGGGIDLGQERRGEVLEQKIPGNPQASEALPAAAVVGCLARP